MLLCDCVYNPAQCLLLSRGRTVVEDWWVGRSLAIERDVSVEHMLYRAYTVYYNCYSCYSFSPAITGGTSNFGRLPAKNTIWGLLSRPLGRSCAEFCAKYAAGPQIICVVFPQSKNLQTGHHFSLKII